MTIKIELSKINLINLRSIVTKCTICFNRFDWMKGRPCFGRLKTKVLLMHLIEISMGLLSNRTELITNRSLGAPKASKAQLRFLKTLLAKKPSNPFNTAYIIWYLTGVQYHTWSIPSNKREYRLTGTGCSLTLQQLH